jgi:DNA-binding CsgD family transcriptional regulator/tetratricopeptide (TPR) repeat protein
VDPGYEGDRSVEGAGLEPVSPVDPGAAGPVLVAPLRGREHELGLIAGHLTELTRGRAAVLVLMGAPGSGKTRLLDETVRLARGRGVHVLSAAGDPDEQLVPLAPLLHALTAGEAPVLAAAEARKLPTGADQRFWLLLELQEHLERAALARPMLICVDDLQWCDPQTLLALRTLPGRLSSHAIMWVLGVRSNVDAAALHDTSTRLRAAGAQLLRLGPLSDHAVEQMVFDLTRARPDDAVLAVARRAEGRPLLIDELIRGLLDDGGIVVDAGVARLVGRTLPVRFTESIRHRTLRMSPQAVRAVQVASVLGRSFTAEQLADMLDVEAAALLAPLQEAMSSDLLIEHGAQLSFRHELIREAVEHSIPAALRRTLRRQAVDVQLRRGIPLAEVALALADTIGTGDDEAVGLLREAAAELARTAPAAAAQLSSRALAVTAEASPVLGVLTAETTLLLMQSGQIAEARAMADSALGGVLAPSVEARTRLNLGYLEATYGSLSEAIRQGRIGLALPDVTDDVRSELAGAVAVHLAARGELEQSEQAVLTARRSPPSDRPRPGDVMVATAASMVEFYRPDWTAALRIAQDAIRLGAADSHYGQRRASAEAWYAIALSMAGRCEQALTACEAGLAQAQRSGNAGAIGLWQMTRARILLDTGRLADARTEAEAALDLSEDLGSGYRSDVMALYTLGRVGLWTGDRELVRRCAADADRMMGDDAIVIRGVGSWLTALVAEADGDYQRGMQVTTEALGRFEVPGPCLSSPLDPTDTPAYVRIALLAGEPERARRAVLAAERRQARNPGIGILAATAVHARGLLSRDGELLQRAATLFSGSPRIIARASACEDAGGLRPESETATEYLTTALGLYERAGDERDAARVRRRLRLRGVRTRRPVAKTDAHGWNALSPAELQVVRLVADGGTNRAIAERLFLSPHTVSSHLRHAFTKLAITSRVELTRIVLAHDSAPSADE